VAKRPPTLLLTLLLLALPLTSQLITAQAHDTLYLASDRDDASLAAEAGIDADIPVCLPVDPRGYRIVYAVDYNMEFCPRNPGWGEIFKIPGQGGTLVLGLNTLETVNASNPALLEKLGIRIESHPSNATSIILGPKLSSATHLETIPYNATRYLTVSVTQHPTWETLASFDDGTPAILEARIGGGRLVLLLYNPSWPAAEGVGGHAELLAGLHHYLAGDGGGIPATAAAVVAAAAAGAAASRASERLWRRILRRLHFLLLLFYRVPHDAVAEHPVRRRILREIDLHGYTTVSSLQRATGLARATLLWHLAVLERADVVRREKVLGTVIYYRRGKRRQAIHTLLLEAVQRRRIIELLSRTGPMGLAEIAEKLGAPKSTVKHHIDILASYGLIRYDGVTARTLQG